MNKLKENKYWIVNQCQQCGEDFSFARSRLKVGGGKFCSMSCSATYRNIHNNPTKCPKVRAKISLNHADVSGKNNPMYGVRGEAAPAYIDGRSSMIGEVYRKIALVNLENICFLCGEEDLTKLDVHHKDFNNKNNNLDNLIFACKSCHQNILHTRKRDKLGRFV